MSSISRQQVESVRLGFNFVSQILKIAVKFVKTGWFPSLYKLSLSLSRYNDSGLEGRVECYVHGAGAGEFKRCGDGYFLPVLLR
jgi:hypothetical protein